MLNSNYIEILLGIKDAIVTNIGYRISLAQTVKDGSISFD